MPSMISFIALPNLVSYVGLAAALLAIAAAQKGQVAAVGALLILSSVCDLLDGRFARLFPRKDEQKAFGTQLDSLLDTIAFGAAPVVAIGFLGAQGAAPGTTRLLCAFAYLLATVTRLGYYNVFSAEGTAMVGMPTTLCNLAWSVLLLLPGGATYFAQVSAVLSILMLAPIRFQRPRTAGIVAIVAVALAILGIHVARILT